MLPEPLGAVALALRDQRLAVAGGEEWLLAGRNAGSHISAERLRERLKRYGITSRPSRHAALLALGARLPAPILAERLGFQQARAAQWAPRAPATPTTSRCATPPTELAPVADLSRAASWPRTKIRQCEVAARLEGSFGTGAFERSIKAAL